MKKGLRAGVYIKLHKPDGVYIKLHKPDGVYIKLPVSTLSYIKLHKADENSPVFNFVL